MSKSDPEAIERLREWLSPGDTVYTNVIHVSRSGMSRNIKVYTFQNNEPLYLSYNVAQALGWGKPDDFVKVGGCGMDMGFHLVYELSATLFPDGFDCSGQRCSSNDHSNGDRDYTPHHHRDGGYALRQRWL